MDLGIKGKKAIVCAASKGLGKGCAQALAREGVDVTICARGAEALNATAKELGSAGVKVTPVACDVTTEAGRKALLAACPSPDILINTAGGPPPGDFKDFSLEDWRKAVEGNMITPIALIHATVYGMMQRGFGRIVNITSASIKHPIAALELSNGARLGLTGAVAVLAQGRQEQCDDQRHPARTVRHRPAARHDAEDGGGAQGGAVGGGGRAQGRGAGGPLRLGGGVRLCRGLSVLGARGLHHGTESADRRRRLSRLALIGHLATAIAWSGAATEPRA